jgi:hypothetical protein
VRIAHVQVDSVAEAGDVAQVVTTVVDAHHVAVTPVVADATNKSRL